MVMAVEPVTPSVYGLGCEALIRLSVQIRAGLKLAVAAALYICILIDGLNCCMQFIPFLP